MSSIERQISVTRGPFFFEQDGELMFQFACDNSTIIGPYPAKPSHIAEYPEALQTFKDAQAQGLNPEPEFVSRERQEKPPSKGLSVLDMIEGRIDEATPVTEQPYRPGETPAVQVGTVGRKAAPVPYGGEFNTKDAMTADTRPDGDAAEKDAILAELETLGAPKPHHLAKLPKLREALAAARGG